MLILILLCLAMSVQAQIVTDKTEAVTLAQKEGKYILLVFSGSDWCQPCIRFDKNVLQNTAFTSYAKDKLIILKCDFPQRKPLSEALLKQNEALAERFNPKGEFPKLILLDAQLRKVGDLEYDSQAIDQFIQAIQQKLPIDTGLKEYRTRKPIMGSFLEIILVGKDNEAAQNEQYIAICIAEAKRINHLISEWIPSSFISQINQQAGKDSVQVTPEVYALLQRSVALSELTQGAFDISFLAYYDYWKFDNRTIGPFDTTQILALAKLVDYRKIELLPNNWVSTPAQTKIGIGGIGQGYIVDCIKKKLLQLGVNNFVVNFSGDIYAHGKRLDGSPWKIGVASPLDKNKIIQWLPVHNFAVVTSGTSEKNFHYQDVIYSHIINTKTGFPIEGLQSATVMSEYTEVADALATSLLVLGPEIGLNLINQLPNTHCIIIDKNQKVYYSDELEIKN